MRRLRDGKRRTASKKAKIGRLDSIIKTHINYIEEWKEHIRFAMDDIRGNKKEIAD